MTPSRNSGSAALSSGRKACDFCRKRKIRCNGELPCSACIRHSRPSQCKVTELPKRHRPTYGQLDAMQAHVDYLTEQLHHASDSTTPPQTDPIQPDEPLAQQQQQQRSRPEASHDGDHYPKSVHSTGSTRSPFQERESHARNTDSVNAWAASTSHHSRRTSAHSVNEINAGPSSIRIADAGTIKPAFDQEGEPATRTPLELPSNEHLSAVLTANAAREHHSEVTNVVAGRLDFDGVDPELAMHLLSLHWNRQHHAYLVTYRPLFMRDMTIGSSGRFFSKLLFHAILFGASKFSDRTEQLRSDSGDTSSSLGLQFLRRVEMLLPEALMVSRITTVQALLLLACTHFARGAESAAWLHSGLAFRMAADLGLFEDGINLVAQQKMTVEELELRRRVAWAAYVIDKIHSLYQGRQVSIAAANVHVPIHFSDQFEENEYWTPIAYQSASKTNGYGCHVYSVSTFTQLCKLTVIMERIIDAFYSIRSSDDTSSVNLQREAERLNRQLLDWYAALPQHLYMARAQEAAAAAADPSQKASSSHAPATQAKAPNLISLHALFHCLCILLHRPFLPYGHLRDVSRQTQHTFSSSALVRSAWVACVDAATQISHLMSLYRNSVTMKGAPQLISYINFCAAGIHVRMAAQSGKSPHDTQSQAAAAASRAVQAALQDFEENEHPNPGVAKAKYVIKRMAMHFSVLPVVSAGRQDRGGGGNQQDPSTADVASAGAGSDIANRASAMSTSALSSQTTLSHDDSFGHGNARDTAPSMEHFDLDAFLSSFDESHDISSLIGHIDGAHAVDDIMFGFLKDC